MLLAMVPVPAGAQCRLCATPPATSAPQPDSRPLSIEVDAVLDFSRVAQSARGGGSVAVDAQSGARTVSGGLVDLGGMALKGSVRVTGEPGRHIRVSMPSTIRLSAPDGGIADVIDLRADLSSDPTIGPDGTLSFSFGGRLVVTGGAAGDFRGRIPITADYQ
jgi:hypothetical protein